MSRRTVVIDDRDTDTLHYQGGWFLSGNYDATNTGQMGTLSSTNDQSAQVSFTFPSPAVAFSYWGIRRCCGGQYEICIDDCGSASPNWQKIDAVNRTDDGHNPPVASFSQTFDSSGIHSVTIRNTADTRFTNGNSQITMDRIELTVVDTPSTTQQQAPPPTTPQTSNQPTSNPPSTTTQQTTSSSSSTATSSATSSSNNPSTTTSASTDSAKSTISNTGSQNSVNQLTGTLPLVTLTIDPSTGSTAADSGPSSSTDVKSVSRSNNIGAIAGGVIGGLGGILIVTLLFMWCRERRRRTAGGSLPPSTAGHLTTRGRNADVIQPFLMQESTVGGSSFNLSGSTGSGLGSRGAVSEPRQDTTITSFSSTQQGSSSVVTPSTATSSIGTPSTGTRSTGARSASSGPRSTVSRYPSLFSSSRRTSRIPRQSVDAGPAPMDIFDDAQAETRTLPPAYGDIFADR